MRIGYIGDIGLHGVGRVFNKKVQDLSDKSKNENLDYLILCGNISDNYEVSILFINTLKGVLLESGIKLRFIIGNSDLYYSNKEFIVDKESKVQDILQMYRKHPCYLPNNPILTRRVRIIGSESWYDYTLYRGKPTKLKNISKKRLGFIKNRDVDYITDSDDYTLGLENTFDIRYCKGTKDILQNRLYNYYKSYGKCTYNVVVMHFIPHKVFLKSGVLKKYFGTFEGSVEYHEIMKKLGVTDCIFAKDSRFESKIYDGIRYRNIKERMEIIEYGED